jgi:hypothetical protein
MPIHGIAALLEGKVNYRYAALAVGVIVVLAMLKAWSGGRKNTWARDWAGKMVLVVVCRMARGNQTMTPAHSCHPCRRKG